MNLILEAPTRNSNTQWRCRESKGGSERRFCFLSVHNMHLYSHHGGKKKGGEGRRLTFSNEVQTNNLIPLETAVKEKKMQEKILNEE